MLGKGVVILLILTTSTNISRSADEDMELREGSYLWDRPLPGPRCPEA